MDQNFEFDIKFKNERYAVKLPVKENHPLSPDNYNMSLKRLDKLKKHKIKMNIYQRVMMILSKNKSNWV